MIDWSKITLEELAGFVSERLRKQGEFSHELNANNLDDIKDNKKINNNACFSFYIFHFIKF